MAAGKVVGMHVISALAGASAAISFASLHQVDIYAVFDQLNTVVADVTKLVAMLSPLVAAGAAAYRVWNTKTVPAAALVVDVGSPSKAETDAAHPPGNSATVETISGVAMGKVVGALLVGLVLVLASGGAQAQIKKPAFTGNLIADVKANNAAGLGILSPQQLLDGIASVNLDGLRYAKAQAKAANNVVTLPCWTAWVALIETSQQPLLDDSGNPLTKPAANVFGNVESTSELLQALQPGGAIQIGCSAMVDATKKSLLQIVSGVVSGNALGLLPIPPIVP